MGSREREGERLPGISKRIKKEKKQILGNIVDKKKKIKMEKQGNSYGMRKRIKNNTRGKNKIPKILKVQYCPARWIWPLLGSFYMYRS